MRVILFDIDGTLLTTSGLGRIAMRRTLMKVLGDENAAEGMPFSGRVDWGIWRDIMGKAGYSADEVDAQIGDYLRLFVADMAAVLAEPNMPKPKLLPRVLPLLEQLAQDENVLLGLVTGNTESGAWLKLGYAGIASYFWFGAFGNESWDRNTLPALALERAARFADGRTFSGADTIVIGDSIHDAACAKAIGAKVIGVATGVESADALRDAGVDLLLPSLADTAMVVEWIYTH